jgi:hypothetical protein
MIKRLLTSAVLVAVVACASLTLAADSQVTFHKDIEPILQRNCQTCHRPGQMAPMSFLTYESVRPWAKAINVATAARKMPPWFADPNYGHISNDRSLKQAEIDRIAAWVDAGAPEGDPKEAPPAVKWPEGWAIQPDIVLDGPVTEIPASPKNNVFEWMIVTIPSNFAQDTWITSVQIKPEHPEVTHHICLGFNAHTPDTKYYEATWIDRQRDEEGAAIPEKGATFGGQVAPGRSVGEDCWVPGQVAADYRAFNAAKLVAAGSDIMMTLHYTPNGKPVTDHVKIGFTLAKEPPTRRYVSLSISAPQDAKQFAIPPGEANWQSPPAEATFLQEVELVFMFPHMHYRGKDMTYTLEYPDGRKEVVLSVPRYDFNWQLGYQTSIRVPKGTKLHVDAHFDNSAGNRFNPNPNRTVYYGEMTWEEMMFPFFGVVVDKDNPADRRKIIQTKVAVGSGS